MMRGLLRKVFFPIVFVFTVPAFLFCGDASAKLTESGDRYYFYFGLGTGIGGFSTKTDVSVKIQGTTAEHQFNYTGGLVSGGVTMGLVGHVGFEYRCRNHFYVAAEINGNIFFDGTENGSYFSSGGYNFALDIASFSATKAGKSIRSGSNAFAGIYGTAKIGWTDNRDALSVYFILGAGYEFISGIISASTSNHTNDIGTEDIQLGGGKVQYGIGLSYYINRNVGFFVQFLMTSPISQVDTKNLSIVKGLTPDVAGVFPKVINSVSYSYFVDFGVNVRI